MTPNLSESELKTPAPPIPDKLFFRIGEVSRLVGVEPYVLRYWESEFPVLSPKKSSSGQRVFRRKDVELLLQIKELLYGKRFTIEGARKALQQKTSRSVPVGPPASTQNDLFAKSPVGEIRRQIAEILDILS